MALALGTVRKFVDTGEVYLAIFTITPSGNYVASGDDFSTVWQSSSALLVDKKPLAVIANGLAGYTYTYDYTNDTLWAYLIDTTGDTDKAMKEVTAGAYPAGITGDTITCVAFFEKA